MARMAAMIASLVDFPRLPTPTPFDRAGASKPSQSALACYGGLPPWTDKESPRRSSSNDFYSDLVRSSRNEDGLARVHSWDWDFSDTLDTSAHDTSNGDGDGDKSKSTISTADTNDDRDDENDNDFELPAQRQLEAPPPAYDEVPPYSDMPPRIRPYSATDLDTDDDDASLYAEPLQSSYWPLSCGSDGDGDNSDMTNAIFDSIAAPQNGDQDQDQEAVPPPPYSNEEIPSYREAMQPDALHLLFAAEEAATHYHLRPMAWQTSFEDFAAAEILREHTQEPQPDPESAEYARQMEDFEDIFHSDPYAAHRHPVLDMMRRILPAWVNARTWEDGGEVNLSLYGFDRLGVEIEFVAPRMTSTLRTLTATGAWTPVVSEKREIICGNYKDMRLLLLLLHHERPVPSEMLASWREWFLQHNRLYRLDRFQFCANYSNDLMNPRYHECRTSICESLCGQILSELGESQLQLEATMFQDPVEPVTEDELPIAADSRGSYRELPYGTYAADNTGD